MEKRKVGYDLIKTIAILFVVIIHSCVLSLTYEKGTASWIFTMLLACVSAVSVPLFFMVSGALLLDVKEEVLIKDLFFKRILKQAIPFILWSVIYVIARIVTKKIDFSFSAFASLIYNPAYYQFWFMYALLAIYLLLPFIQAIVLKLKKQHIEYLLVLWLVFSILLPFINWFFPQIKISSHSAILACGGYLGYFVSGFYLKKHGAELSCKKAIVFAVIAILLMVGASLLEFYFSKDYKGYFSHDYLTPLVVFASASIFVLFQNAKYNNQKVNGLLKETSRLSIGVFYVHMLVLTLIEALDFLNGSNVLLLVSKIVLTYIVSMVISFLISKIPYVKKLLMGL